MKKVFAAIFLAAFAVWARGDVLVIMDAQTVAGVGTVTLAPGVVQAFLDTSGSDTCAVYVYSAAGSTSLIKIEGAPTSTGPWFDLVRDGITDVGTTPKGFWGPCPAFVRANASTLNSGAVTAKFERRHK